MVDTRLCCTTPGGRGSTSEGAGKGLRVQRLAMHQHGEGGRKEATRGAAGHSVKWGEARHAASE